MNNTKEKKIAVFIPCHNEEEGIRHVIKAFPFKELEAQGYYATILVIDNNSTDRTADVARSLGAIVVEEPKKGKGNAVRRAFSEIPKDTDYVVMMDGDNTYKAQEIPRMVEPLASGFCDVIVGSRLGGKINDGAFHFTNRLINWTFAFLVRTIYNENLTDVLSGFFAWKKDAADKLNKYLVSEGFAIEMEMITKMVRLGFQVYSVPITYDLRKGQSKISKFKDGMVILTTLVKYIFWKP